MVPLINLEVNGCVEFQTCFLGDGDFLHGEFVVEVLQLHARLGDLLHPAHQTFALPNRKPKMSPARSKIS